MHYTYCHGSKRIVNAYKQPNSVPTLSGSGSAELTAGLIGKSDPLGEAVFGQGVVRGQQDGWFLAGEGRDALQGVEGGLEVGGGPVHDAPLSSASL